MSEAALSPAVESRPIQATGLVTRIAWRNLWRNKRRTWLTAGGIAFATLLVTFAMTMQRGAYGMMIESATGLIEGHIQVSHFRYPDDTKLEQTLTKAAELMHAVDDLQGLEAAPRAGAFALVSAEERSFGGFVWGVDFDREVEMFTFFNGIQEGRLPQSDDEIVIGRTMARNVGVAVGDELVMLGSGKQGGIAAMAQTVVGIYESGQAELDRTLLFTRLTAVQNVFELGDELHVVSIRIPDHREVYEERERIQGALGQTYLVRTWDEYMPEVVQAIEIDRIGGYLMYGAILILVSFSVINTFLMIVFERTREFGMLLAVGMRAPLIMRQVLTEALFMWVVGVAVGWGLASVFVGYLMVEGVPVAGFEEIAGTFYISDRIYPAVDAASILTAPVVLLIGTQLAGLIATLRIRSIAPVEALRGE